MSTRTFNEPQLQDKIRFRAYQIFEERGYQHGRDLDDWLQAEAEVLRSKLAVTPIRAAGNNKRNHRTKRVGS